MGGRVYLKGKSDRSAAGVRDGGGGTGRGRCVSRAGGGGGEALGGDWRGRRSAGWPDARVWVAGGGGGRAGCRNCVLGERILYSNYRLW